MDAALEMASNGFKVYPTVRGKKMPFKGTHAQLDATNDKEEAFNMFQAHPDADVSLKLENMIVLDVDRHEKQADGFNSLQNAGIQLPKDTRIELSPSGGAHLFFRYSGQQFNHLDLLPGVEARGDQIKIAPSKGYELRIDAPIQQAPEWLTKLIEQKLKPKYQPGEQYVHGQITFLGKKLNEIMDGAPEGQRNTFLTKQIGFLIGQGVKPSKAHRFMWWIAQNELTGHKPIKKSEFDATFRSVVQREQAKVGGASSAK